MITNVIAAFTLVLAVHPAAAQTPTTMLSDAVQHASGWRQGRAEALRDIKNDRMCIYSAGMRDPGEWLDQNPAYRLWQSPRAASTNKRLVVCKDTTKRSETT